MKASTKNTILSFVCMGLTLGGFVANMAKSKSDEEIAKDELKKAIEAEVKNQLSNQD